MTGPWASNGIVDSHVHTPLCGHAVGEPEEYAEAAISRGLSGIIVTCHNPMPLSETPNIRMRCDQLGEYVGLVARARAQMKGVTDVGLGLECDYLPGCEAWVKPQLATADFDYVLGAVHPHLPEYRTRFWSGDALAYQRLYFEHLADAAESGLFDALAHPDLVKVVTASDWEPARIGAEIGRSLDRIAATGLAMELNTSGCAKAVAEMFPGEGMLLSMCERSMPVVIGSDAHAPDRAGAGFVEALVTLARVGYREVSVFKQRCRTTIPIEVALAQLESVHPQP